MTVSPEPGGRSPVVNMSITAGAWPDEAVLRDLVQEALDAAVTVLDGRQSVAGELSVMFTDDAGIRELNSRFRGRDQATNVLSFPAAPSPAPVRPLGDIVLASETVSAEARAGGLTLSHHITHLLVHGFLHLLGFDHVDDSDAAEMENLETAILATLDVADPHAGG